MEQSTQRGFTIIEVMLFLAISAMLIVIAMTAMTGSIRNARFNDATKSMEAFLEAQFSQVQAGSFDTEASGKRPVCSTSSPIETYEASDTTAGEGSCLILGRAIDFTDRGAVVYAVLGDATQDYTDAGSSFSALARTNPQVWIDGGVIDTHELNWQTSAGVRQVVYAANMVEGSQSGSFDRIVFLRGINTEAVTMYVTNTDDPASASLKDLVASNAGTISNLRNAPALICVKSDDFPSLRGYVMLSGTGRGSGFSIGSIESSIRDVNEAVFTSVVTRAGYGGISCAD